MYRFLVLVSLDSNDIILHHFTSFYIIMYSTCAACNSICDTFVCIYVEFFNSNLVIEEKVKLKTS